MLIGKVKELERCREDYAEGYLDALSDILDELSEEEGNKHIRLLKEYIRQIIAEF